MHPTVTRRWTMAALAGLSIAPRPTIAETPRRGGTLTVFFYNEPPMLVSFLNSSSLTCSAKTTEGLLAYDHDMNPLPQLATAWEVADGGRTYRFTLRRDVKWHDGQDFTAADVAFSIETLKRSHPRGRSTFAHLTAIETPDPHSVVLRLAQPIPYLLRAFVAGESPMVPRHRYAGGDPFASPNNSAPIGTGPFRLKEWARGSHVVFERNAEYWDQPRPYLDRLIVKFINDPAARSVALETGDVDVGYRTPVALNDVERLRRVPNLDFETKGYEYSQNVINISFNLDHPQFAQLKVRQAVAHAISREQIARIIYYGQVNPCVTPIGPALRDFHDPSPTPYPTDLRAAERLLDEAGLPRGADRLRFQVTFDASPLLEESRRLGEYLRSTLGRIGIGVELRTQDVPSYLRRVYTDREFDFTCGSLSNLFDPTVGVQRLYWSKNYVRGVPFSNATHYSNPRVDALLEGAAIEQDLPKRQAMFKEFQEIVMREVPDLTIGVPRWLTIHTKRAQGHSEFADGIEGSFSHALVTS